MSESGSTPETEDSTPSQDAVDNSTEARALPEIVLSATNPCVILMVYSVEN